MRKFCTIPLTLLGFIIWCSFIISISFADDIHSEGYCVMRGQCGGKSIFGKQLNCPYNGQAVKVNEVTPNFLFVRR